MIIQRKKPALLMWTTAWRRLNKKSNTEGAAKKKSRKVVRIQRAIVGATLEDVSRGLFRWLML
jgi:large subunit ribosomal protein L24e